MMEFQDFYCALGANIRSFRKLQNLTQTDLAKRLNKSLACVSKYEKGAVSIDALTVYEIADALSISPQMLLPDEEHFTSNCLLTEMLPAILKQRFVYVYLYIGERKEIVLCCLEIQHENAHVVLYVDLKDKDDYKSCSYIMTGEISCCETNVIIHCTNPLIHGDYLYWRESRMKTAKLVVGILSICLSAMVLFQSCAAGAANTLEANGEVGGTGGFIVAITLLAGGIVMIATRKSEKKGGSIAALILYLLGALIGFATAGSYSDLKIWAVVALLVAIMNVVALLQLKKSNHTNGEEE